MKHKSKRPWVKPELKRIHLDAELINRIRALRAEERQEALREAVEEKRSAVVDSAADR